MNYRSFAGPALAVVAFAAFAACSKTTVQPAPAPAPAPAAGTTTTTTTTTMAAPTGGMPAGVTMAMVATGDSIFHARGCKNCHGMDGKGATNGPDLTSGNFTHIDGTYDSMVQIITTGIAAAALKAHPNPMPARGGRPTPLTDEQIRDVAAYVYSLSHKM